MTPTRPYKRSWKNLLINKRYQLRFTLFMVGLAVVLMALLGWWVVRVADEATTVAKSRVRGDRCADIPGMVPTEVVVDAGEMTFDEPPAPPAPAPGPGAEAGSAARPRVVMDEPSMTLKEIRIQHRLPADYNDHVRRHLACRLEQGGKLAELDRGKQRIVLVLVASSVLIILGLIIFGIKMTHRVAGPLYKVSLYLAKMRDGRYDKVYDLRKGDQLVSFYEHFRQAHAGVVALEQADRDRIAAALDAAAADGVFERSPEARRAAEELRAILDRKEKALGDQR